MQVFVIIPVKSLIKSKTRLSSILNPDERRILTLIMLQDVLEAVRKSNRVGRVLIVGADVEVKMLAEKYNADYMEGGLLELNRAVRGAVGWCVRRGAESVIILPADIPLISPTDINNIVDMASDRECIVIVPSDDGGTTVLLQRPPNIISPRFGPGSFRKHLEEAYSRGFKVKIYRSIGASLDIDSPKDLEHLLHVERSIMTTLFLKRIGLEDRMRRLAGKHPPS